MADFVSFGLFRCNNVPIKGRHCKRKETIREPLLSGLFCCNNAPTHKRTLLQTKENNPEIFIF